MFFAGVGLFLVIIGSCLNPSNLIYVGFAFIGFDLTIELANLKSQLYHVGKAIRDELHELRKKMK